jgi:pimeloyl-ACP methyl ester carboxylesterase
MIMTHGWPGSILEFLKAIGPLTDPTAHGGKAEDAFHLVIPSIPGFGFSAKPTEVGWGSDRTGRAWATLMQRLGYARYVSQGGDCGSVISQRMALQKVPGLIGIHLNMPAVVPADIARTLAAGDPAPPGLSPKERAAFDQLEAFYRDNAAYAAEMNTRPQTIGYALVDSPVAMAAWMYEKVAQWTYSGGDPERVLTRDEILDDFSLYWLTGTGASAARIYWEDHSNNFNARGIIELPVAVSVFPGEIFRAPRSWAERCYRDLRYFNEASDGGHFAAWEQPKIFAEEVRAAFRPLR